MGAEMQAFVNNVGKARDAGSDGGTQISRQEYADLKAQWDALPTGWVIDGRATGANQAMGSMATALVDSLKSGHTYEQFVARHGGFASQADQLGI